MPSVLPFAGIPTPRDAGRVTAGGDVRLRWIAGRNAISHEVSFGTTNPPPVKASQRDTTFVPGPLEPGMTYYWRVDEVTASGKIAGPVWRFTTAPTHAQPAPADTQPSTVRIALVGDSTVTDAIGWGRGFERHLTDRAHCVNLARNGRSSRSYIAEGHWQRALAEGADYVLIQFGHNDMPGKGPERETDPATTYREFLARYVEEARAAGATPILVTSLTRRFFTAEGRIASDLVPYVEAAKQVASAKDVPLVDLHARSIELLDRAGPDAADQLGIINADGTRDRTHLSERGSLAFGAIVAEELGKAVPGLAPYIKR